MSKPRICQSCHWLQNRAEPCWSCSRWGKGKTDHYIPAEETLKEYLERKEREDMRKEKSIENLNTDELMAALSVCTDYSVECKECPLHSQNGCLKKLKLAAFDRIKQLQQELIDERDRYDRLVSFELDEAQMLNAAKDMLGACMYKVFFGDAPHQSPMATASPRGGEACRVPQHYCKCERGNTSSTADERDDTVRRCAEYVAEKHLQMDDTEWHIIPGDYWRNICGINARQEKKGVEKYGQHLEENTTLSTVQRIEHAQEELIDALKYLEHLKAVAGDKLTANDYQRMAMRTAGEYDTDYDQLRNAAYGLNGEAGEVIDLLKKHEFQGHDLPEEKLIDECGDVLWYCALLADALGFTMEQVMNRNIDKLRKRYPDGFDKNRSINREG